MTRGRGVPRTRIWHRALRIFSREMSRLASLEMLVGLSHPMLLGTHAGSLFYPPVLIQSHGMH